MPAAPAATPPKPNMAAMMAITRNITVQRNIVFLFLIEHTMDSYKIMPAAYITACVLWQNAIPNYTLLKLFVDKLPQITRYTTGFQAWHCWYRILTNHGTNGRNRVSLKAGVRRKTNSVSRHEK
jgi:hypothetical protein